MNWNRILLYSIFCCIASLLLTIIVGGGVQTIFLCAFAIGIGYAYGTFQMMYIYKKQMNDIIKELKDK